MKDTSDLYKEDNTLDSDDLKWVKDQREKMEKIFDSGRDRYNTLDESENENLYTRIIQADSLLYPKRGQTWGSYLTELKVHMEHAFKKNWKVHVVIGVRGKPWYTHTRSDGCFMCEDINLIHSMYSVMLLMAEQYPGNKF